MNLLHNAHEHASDTSQVLIEDATGQLDAVMVGADLDEFFAPLAQASERWAPGSAQGSSLTDKMECALQWLETGKHGKVWVVNFLVALCWSLSMRVQLSDLQAI